MLIQADAFHLPYRSNYFHAIVTSPPYWGLRKYAGEQGEEPLGLEATPERHIERMVEIFREVRRVLRDDGVVWLSYGDCYGGSNSPKTKSVKQNTNLGSVEESLGGNWTGNLMLMPHRLAIALQDDGWIVRNDLVWFKRNPMPESVAGWRWDVGKPCDCSKEAREEYIAGVMEEKGVERHRALYMNGGHQRKWTDPNCPKCHGTGKVGEPVLRKSSWRHTRAHEYVFQLVKKMGYYCNQEAVREGVSENSLKRQQSGWDGNEERDYSGGKQNNLSKWMGHAAKSHTGRNPRSVLDVPTAPYKGAHYATFPPKLIAPLIRASVPRRCCPECGMAWAPVVEKRAGYDEWANKQRFYGEGGKGSAFRMAKTNDAQAPQKYNVKSYRPTCECGHEDFEPGIVLDIFGGSGTTGMVAKELLRRWVVMDISRPYLDEQSKIRTRTGTPSNTLDGLPMFEEMNSDAQTN